ncbi:hypothetical protein GCM10009836_19680 [Pseudonocardia ailaonensis]|uniref:Polyketide cyclase n=1 Tax=Pseudonocardia ailaonensis TaxID=367279 RepID=A0ABN2MVN1_9PSEU
MRYRATVRIAAPPERAWEILAAVTEWPSWTPTVTAVQTGPGPLRVGQVVRVSQPGRRPTDYTVSELTPGRSFTWGRAGAAVRQEAGHEVEAADGGCAVHLEFAMEGPLGSLLGALAGGRIRSMVDTEAASLKARAEA